MGKVKLKPILYGVIILFFSVVEATANPSLCNAISFVERAQTAQLRLSKLESLTSGNPDVRLLIAHMSRVDEDYIILQFPQSTRSGHGRIVSDFLGNTRVIVHELEKSNYQIAQSLLLSRMHQQSLRQITQIVPQYDCPANIEPPINVGRALGNKRGSENFNGTSFEPDQLVTIIPISFFAILGAFFTIKFMFRRSELNRRRAKRFVTNIQTQVKVHGQIYACNISDLSCTGAKISGKGGKLLCDEQRGAIKIGKNWTRCHHKWSNEHFTGVQFDRPLPILLVRKTVKFKK